MTIEDLTLENYLPYYSKEALKYIAKGVALILAKYDKDLVIDEATPRLDDEIVNVLKVILSLSHHFGYQYLKSNLTHESYKSVSMLQSLKSELVRMKDRHIDISFKIPGKKAFVVNNTIVSRWIREQLLKSYNEFDISGDFGEAMFLLDSKDNPNESDDKTTQLNSYADKPLSFAKAVYSFCDSLMTYIKITFQLTAHQAMYLSEQQVAFLYEILCLLGWDGFEEKFDYDEKPTPTDRDRLYQMLNLQHRIRH